MKKVITAFILVFIVGILSGGIYEFISYRHTQNIQKNVSTIIEKEKSVPNTDNAEIDYDSEEQKPSKKEHLVTNPDKICETPGCGKAVFVTYKGRELCVECYGKAKIRDTKNK